MTAPKPPPLDVVRRWVDCAPPYPDLPLRNLARAYLALVEAARPFAGCKFKWNIPFGAKERKRIDALKAACACPGCRLAALLPPEDET